MNYYKRIYAFVFAVSLVGVVMPAASSEQKKTSWLAEFFRNVACGSITGATEVGLNQPLIRIKNELQQSKAISMKERLQQLGKLVRVPRELYRGFGVNAGCMGPVTAIQIATSAGLKTVMPGDDAATSAFRSFLGGVASGLACNSVELVIIQQGVLKEDARTTMRMLFDQGGYPIFARGMVPKVLRDGGFGVGFLSTYPWLEDRIRAATESDVMATAGATLGAGLGTTVVTHPFDTLSTRMQADSTGEKIKGMCDAFKQLCKENGLKGLYAGVVPRGTRVALAIVVMNKTKTFLEDRFGDGASRVDMGDFE